MRKTMIGLLALTCCFGFVSGALAESATKEEVVAKVKQAAELVQTEGIDAAVEQIGDPEGQFVWKDSYVFLMDLDGKMLAHPIKPELTQSSNLLQVKDSEGKPLFVEFVSLANQEGEGWVGYQWPKPGASEPSQKTTYIYRIKGTPYFAGAGVYE